jgi:uncharacterized protein (TIGR03083 family)
MTSSRTVLDFDEHVALLDTAAREFVQRFASAGPHTPVPTCPEWQARDLVVHLGIVHRWAAAHLRGDPNAQDALDESDVLAAVADGELPEWSRAGSAELLHTLASVAPDVAALVFLNDAGAPREFWARRQAHESTIHAVDALAAALGRVPTAAETGITTPAAVDGIDEILRGFFTRGRSKLYEDRPVAVRVAPTDAPQCWTLRAGPDGAVTERTDDGPADVTFSGTATQLYLGLWNRGAEIGVDGDPALLERWRAVQRVRWA